MLRCVSDTKASDFVAKQHAIFYFFFGVCRSLLSPSEMYRSMIYLSDPRVWQRIILPLSSEISEKKPVVHYSWVVYFSTAVVEGPLRAGRNYSPIPFSLLELRGKLVFKQSNCYLQGPWLSLVYGFQCSQLLQGGNRQLIQPLLSILQITVSGEPSNVHSNSEITRYHASYEPIRVVQ